MEKIADRIIRDTLSEIDEAVGFFKSTLPTKIVKILNFDTLKSAQTTFISEDLKEYRTDLLFQIQTVDRSPAQIFILFEHKSNQDPKVFSQLLSYLAQVYASQTKPMPVIPFVFYHGKQGWKLGSQFVDWFKFSEQQRQLYLKYLPNFSFEIFDLTKQKIHLLNLSPFFHKLLEVMNSIDMGTFSEDLFLIFRDSLSDFLNEKGLVKLRKLLQYIYIKGGVSVEQVTRAISHESPKLKEEAMATILEMLKQEFIDGEQRGRRKGIEEGIEQGLLRGVQELLIKQLERRFGILTENEREVICNCKNQDRLEVASIVLLESKTKEEVIDKLK